MEEHKIQPIRRIVLFIVGLFIFTATYFSFENMNPTIFFKYDILYIALLLIGTAIGTALMFFSIFPHYLFKQSKNPFKRLVRKLIGI